MSEENKEQQTQQTISTTGGTQSGNATPTPRAVKMIDEVRSPVKPLPILRKNWSWVSFIVVLVYIVVIALVSITQVSSQGMVTESGEKVVFLIVTFLVGAIGGIIVYNLGKIIGAVLSGYSLTYLCLSGLCWNKYRGDHHFYFRPAQILEFHAAYAPGLKKYKTPEEALKANPLIMLVSGYALWAVVFIIVLVVGLTVAPASVKWYLVYGAAHSVCYVLYQLCPLRQDFPSDMFSLIASFNADDRKAFNILAWNRGYEFADVEMAVPDFKAYDDYWKAQTYIYLLRNHLYHARVEEAIQLFTQIHAVSNYFNEVDKAQVASERLYVLLLLNDIAGADKLFIELPKSVKTEVVKCETLSSYRTSLMIAGLITNQEDAAVNCVNNMLKSKANTCNSLKLSTELRYFLLAYRTVKEKNPRFALPSVQSLTANNAESK